jgi:pSer/pThr/pTyr-binding forkhead associated (FHA) protein
MSVQPQKNHCLMIQDQKGKQEFILEEEFYSLGRDRDCSIRIRSQFVSRHHAVLKRVLDENKQSYYEIEDGDGEGKRSSNGLLINEVKKQNHLLQDGDKIVFGPQVFAVYRYRQVDQFNTETYDDPYDITLIDPAMAEDGETPE